MLKTIKLWLNWAIHINWITLIYGTLKRLISGSMQIYEVWDNLYQGSKFTNKDFITLEKLGIEAVIDLEGMEDTHPTNIKEYKYWPIKDQPKLPDLERLEEVATWGHERWSDGKKVLVHCRAGCNRSGLVNGVILNKIGFSGKDAVDLIRSKVPGGLTNMVFAEYVKGL